MKAILLRRVVPFLGLVTLLVLVSARRVPTTFNLTARTQLVVFEASENHRSPWHLRRATLVSPAGEEEFSGTLLVDPGTRVVLERIGAGPLRMGLRASESGTRAGILTPEGGGRSRVAGDGLALVGEPSELGGPSGLVLPLTGRIQVGTEVGQDLGVDPALLLSGRISLLAHTLLGDRRYDAGAATLQLGDYPRVDALGDAYGLLTARDDRDMLVDYRVVARSMRIDRFGSMGYDVFASLLDRIANDHTVQAVWAAALFTLAWVGRGRKALTKKRQEANENA